jgi:hypothetical protein
MRLIPLNSRRVVKFNPVDESLTEIGPDLGDERRKWVCGVLADSGCIFCAPRRARQFLKVDTINGTVPLLDAELSEEEHRLSTMRASGALAMLLMAVSTLCLPMLDTS